MSLRSDQREDGESTSGSSEAKTDRYGFLLVNGDTNNDSDDPCLELVRHREMKWINLISQWDQVLEKKHSKIKAHCHKGIPASVRPKCWPLLCGATQRKQNNKDLYKTLESSPGQQSWIDVITRDTDRQFPFHEMFQSKDSYGQQGLLQVLKAYTQFRPDEGYCQAQGPVAAVLLMHMPMEEAFWCLVQISELYLPGYYSPLLEGVLFDAAILFGVLKRTCPAAYKHMQKQGVEPLMFATDWLMCLYTRHLPFKTLLRVWDLFFCNGVRVLFQVAVVLVRRCLGDARQRRECEGQMETLERLRSVRGRIQQEQADAFIQEVCSVPLSLAELQRQTEKELEKWRKERPNSTFDPRDRCHGYYMIWEKGKGKERENEKKERQSGKLRAPVARSYSSLSPAILRKKWRKTGSKTETEEWEGKGLTKRDSDEDERRRASVCGVAGEIQAKTPEEFSTHLQKELNTTTKPQRISATKIETFTDSNDAVFEEDQNNVVVIVVVPSKEPDPQTANIQLETGKQQDPETQKEQTSRDDQGEDISIHQNQPEGQTQQEEPQFSRLEDSRKNLEEEIQVNESKQEEETEIRTWNPEEDIQFHISTQVEDVKIIYQEVEHEVNTDIREEQRQENETNMEMDSIKQEKETHLGSTKEESVHQCDIQETKRIEHEVEIQEEKEAKSKTDKQEVELKIHLHGTKEEAMYNCDIQEKEIKTKRTEHEIETQEEEVTKSKNYNQEVEREEEQEIMANSSEPEEQILNAGEVEARNREQEIEIQEANEITANSSEYELKQEIKAKGSEQEVKILNAGEVQARNRKQEIEIQEANEITANSSEYELKKQEEQEIKANSGEQEVKIHLEKENRANCSEKEVEIEDGDKQANSANEEEKSKFCLLHTEDAPTDKKQQQEVEQTLKTEEEMHSNVQNPEDQKDAEEQAPSFQEEGRVKDDCCERGENTDVEKTQQEQESERENEELISDASGRETEETITKEENRSGVNLAADREASESVASSNIQPEMVMEQSGESETPRDSNKTQEEKKKGEKISKPEQTSNSRNPVPPQPDEKEEEVEVEINITTESNPLKVPCGANQHPQLRLRRSSSTHTSYPTILSEETFRDPQQNIKRDSCPRTTEAEASDITESKQTEPRSSKMKQKPQPQAQWKSDKPKRRGLFHRLRADTPSKSTIPKIVIQDFSEEEEKLSSKERRRRRRTQERKEKEDEKERKKLEKELEKEKTRERKKPQTRGKSFQVLSRKHDGGGGDGDGERSASQGAGRKRTSYSESYF